MRERLINGHERHQVGSALKQHPVFSMMTESERADLLGAVVSLEARAGAVMFSEAHPARYCLLLSEGVIAGVRYTSGGDEKFFRTFHAGDVAGLTAMFLPEGQYLMSYRALEPTRAYGLPRNRLRAIAESNGRFAAAMLEHTSCRLQASLNQVDFFTDSSAEQRVAAFLLQLRSQQNSQEVRLPCRQKQVALLLVVREETVSRVLNDFRREGVLASRRSPIGLLDVDFLEQLVGPERAHLQLGAF